MPRGKPVDPAQLDAVVAAAGRVFARLGYRRTRMADVAREAGLSPGALYTYVEGKEALFHLVVTGTAGAEPPVANPPTTETVTAVDRRLRATVPTTAMRRAARAPVPTDVAVELRELFGELYDAIAAEQQLLSIIEKSARDFPGLAEQYYRQGRRAYIRDVGAYLRKRAAQGLVRAVPDAAVTARYILETCAWFAWHRHGDHDSAMISDAAARETVLDMTVAALAPEPGR